METPGQQDVQLEFPKNPLLCPICHDYFIEPCILSCYHTFCARCLRGREQERRLICPFCRYELLSSSSKINGIMENPIPFHLSINFYFFFLLLRQPSLLKDGTLLPPPDILMRQLIEIANSENPPCSNCDKRDRANMYYCNTCGMDIN